MKYILFCFLPFIVITSCKTDQKCEKADKEAEKCDTYEAHYLKPIRPGEPGVRPFWNVVSSGYKHPPAFDIEELEGAAQYRIILTADSLTGDLLGTEYSFVADKPWRPMTPVWADVPVGYVKLRVEALDKAGNVLKTIGEKRFYRSAIYNGPYRAKRMSYRQTLDRAFDYYYQLPEVRHWLANKSSNQNYIRSAYPSKTIGGTFKLMLQMAQQTDDPGKRDTALLIAMNAADYLMSTSIPEGEPLEGFPLTYEVLDGLKGSFEYEVSVRHEKEIMMFMPAWTALKYLDLYDETKEQRYFDYVMQIARTYQKTILDQGSWYLLTHMDSLIGVKPNICIPSTQLLLFDRLERQYGVKDFVETEAKCLQWIMGHPVKDWYWEGQFEDIEPRAPYQNLSKELACEFVHYLMDNNEESEDHLPLAREIMAFVEDQFVVWEHPTPIAPELHDCPECYPYSHSKRVQNWITPCALEQYKHYYPIDHSAGAVMDGWLSIYRVTGEPVYLEKARELAKTAQYMQNVDGRLPTYWMATATVHSDWINCSNHIIEMLSEIDRIEKGQ